MTDQSDNRVYGFHCLAYLDILGQRRQLRKFSRIPKDDPETRQLLKDTAGVVIRLRERAHACFETLQRDTQYAAVLPSDLYQRLREGKESVKTQNFSDSLVMWVSLSGDVEQLRSIIGVYGCMATCCLLHLASICEDHPIRGGIEIGPGLELSDTEVYGAVLEKAHFIESTLADYPRIVVGDELLKYLDVAGSRARSTPLGTLIESLASQARGLITQDSDGMWMLDFLGERVAGLSKTDIRQKLFTGAQSYIDGQKQIAYDTQDYKHLSRYFRLGAYFEGRADTWNAEKVNSPPQL